MPFKAAFVLLLAGSCQVNVTAQQQPSHPFIPICDVLRNPSSFNGKVIAVRGERLVGGHGLYLRGENCSDILTTKGYRWPPMIWIVNIKERIERQGYDFEQYNQAILDIDHAERAALQRKGPAAKIARVEVTFVGLFETHSDFDSAVFYRVDGSSAGVGFGPLSGAPGQLFIQSAQDITVEFEGSFETNKP